MQLAEDFQPTPRALRGFIEGVQSLRRYLETNEGKSLEEAEAQLCASLAADPSFKPAQYYQAIVLTHARKTDEAIKLLEMLSLANPPFKAEVLYYLAFAYSREYDYDLFKKALAVIDNAEQLASYRLFGWSLGARRSDL